jgi:hypothetical protein
MNAKQESEIDYPDQLITDCETYRKDIEPELQPNNKIIQKASELMAKVTQITKSIEVLHPGNMGQYHQLSLEYGVRLFPIKLQIS